MASVLSISLAGEKLLHANPDVPTTVDIDIEVAPVSVFYDALAPYGEWIATTEYGWAWIPFVSVVGPDFIPYATNGRWLYTDAGWFFESDYQWGWAPFHYGRWYFDQARGWIWVPGRVWAPAWVDWRIGTGFTGWSPRPPRPVYGRPHRGHWVFAHDHDFTRPHIHKHLIPRKHARRAYDRTSMVRRTRRVGDATIFRGPRAAPRRTPNTRPIHIVPPRRGVVGRVHIVDRTGTTHVMRARPKVRRPVERPAPRIAPSPRPPQARAQRPQQAVRGPVRATAPRRWQHTRQRQPQRSQRQRRPMRVPRRSPR